MNSINCLIVFCSLILFSTCKEDTTDDDGQGCGKSSQALCYAHNASEFVGLNNMVVGNATYDHANILSNGISFYLYKVKVNSVCTTSAITANFAVTLKSNVNAIVFSEVSVNGTSTRIPMIQNGNIYTASYSDAINIPPGNFDLIFYTNIQVNSGAKNEDDMKAWYDENVALHGMTVDFRLPR